MDQLLHTSTDGSAVDYAMIQNFAEENRVSCAVKLFVALYMGVSKAPRVL